MASGKPGAVQWSAIVNSEERNQKECENRCIDKKVAGTTAPPGNLVIAANPLNETKSQYQAANRSQRNRREVGQVGNAHKWALKATKENIALIAGERLRLHAGAFGQKQTIKPVIDDLAAVYGVTLTEAEALQAANSATDFMMAFEQMCHGRWLSDAEVAAMRPLAA